MVLIHRALRNMKILQNPDIILIGMLSASIVPNLKTLFQTSAPKTVQNVKITCWVIIDIFYEIQC